MVGKHVARPYAACERTFSQQRQMDRVDAQNGEKRVEIAHYIELKSHTGIPEISRNTNHRFT